MLPISTSASWSALPKGLAIGVLTMGLASHLAAQQEKPASPSQPQGAAATSVEQGQTPLEEAFSARKPRWQSEKKIDTGKPVDQQVHFNLDLRTMYLGRHGYNGQEVESLATGGWAGVKTPYLADHLAFGVTAYTGQHLMGDQDRDGAGLLARGQEGYTALGELYADVKLMEGLNLAVGRKEYDTPFINRNDNRLTPNTFEAISLMGGTPLGSEGASLRYGLGYVDRIKERNSDDFVSMSVDAGAEVERGVFAAGALYKKGGFSLGGLDYFSPDIINIGFAEAKYEFTLSNGLKPRVAVQFVDQRSVGDDLLLQSGDDAQLYGFKAELPVGSTLFTAAYTDVAGDMSIQSPWAGHPSYTSVQYEDFNRAGERAFMLRAGYDFNSVKGLSAYALWVHGLEPDDPAQRARDEYNFNVQWAATEGVLKGLSLRVRYAIVHERAATTDDLTDLRLICNYAISF